MEKKYNYILSFGGWIGLVITLLLVIFFNKCTNPEPQIIKEKTEIHNYYDSSAKLIPVKYTVPGDPILIPVPVNVDTAKILAYYFSKNPYSRVFEDSNLIATVSDTICQNRFLSPAKFTYKWLKPIKTVESSTVTIELPKNIQLFAGGHIDFSKNLFQDFGPDIYLQTKHGQLFGVGANIYQKSISVKAAINLNDAFRNKKK